MITEKSIVSKIMEDMREKFIFINGPVSRKKQYYDRYE